MRQWLSSAAPALMPGAYTRLGDPRALAVTIDDGPHPSSTPPILETLASTGIPATFFLTADALCAYPSLVGRILAEGHAVQLHGWRHDVVWRYSRARFRRETVNALEAFRSAGIDPVLYRPPHGRMNPLHVRTLRELGLRLTLWSHMPMEFALPRASSERFLLRRMRGGDVVVLHDQTDCLDGTTALIEKIHAQVECYRLKTVLLPYTI